MCCVWMNVAFERSMERKKECVYVCVWKKEGERERDKFMLWYAGSEYNYILYILLLKLYIYIMVWDMLTRS